MSEVAITIVGLLISTGMILVLGGIGWGSLRQEVKGNRESAMERYKTILERLDKQNDSVAEVAKEARANSLAIATFHGKRDAP